MVHGVTTEWDDIQVKMGNYTPHEKVETGMENLISTTAQLEVYDSKYVMSERQLEQKAEDDIDFDEDDFMQDYRQQRLAQMKEQAAKARFGSVIEISKPEWDMEITRAPADTWVVIALYQPQ